MNQQTLFRPLAVASLLAAAALFTQPVSAQTASNVWIFKAYNSRGVDTGTCISSDAPGGYVLSSCTPHSNSSQQFTFDTNGQGGKILQNGLCLLVLTDTNDPWVVGRRVSKHICDASTGGVAMNWRWTDQKIIATQSPNQAFCLTANSSEGPGLFLGNCNNSETLTHWGVARPDPAPSSSAH